ncbi:glycosyltransferase family 4 protein [Vibrio splendidus]|uniref:glycosyltransferase family 4 protein n=1 Tax=Vibrio splendidus TaxID=29497 RepID=UPI00352DFC18
MKVLFYVPSIAFGGGESYIINLIKETGEKYQYNIRVLTACSELYRLLKKLKFDVKLIATSPSLSPKMFFGLMMLNVEIRKTNPDIVFLNGLPESGAMARFILAPNSIKVVVCHSNEYWLNNDTWSIKKLIRKTISSNFLKYLDKVIVITEEAAKSLRGNNLFRCDLEKIYNGIPLVDIEGSHEVRHPPVFGRISRLCEGKGNEMLIRATARIISRGIDVRLVVAGNGEQFALLKAITIQLGIESNVSFIGHVEPDSFFSKIDCMVSPSDMEALPTVISEAMSCQIPIISTCVGGVPEMLEHMVSGYLIPPKDEDKLVEAMIFYLDNKDKFECYASNAFISFTNKFSIEASTLKTWKFINDRI